MAGQTAGQWWRRRRLWALCLPCFFLLWDHPATGMESTVSPSPAPAMPCAAFTEKTCEECVRNTKCLWCIENSTCMDYPVSKLIPPSSLCILTEAYWAICFVNFEAIIITISVVAGSLLLLIMCCCCYCCRRRRPRGKRASKKRAFSHIFSIRLPKSFLNTSTGRVAEEEESFIRDREEKRLQSLQRKHERKVKHDEIRKKYGLLQDSDHPYSRYENE
ncbi:pituitary tumor-transforming gene 1 protein-interacting protein-like isoform X1 [Elgaria multicarinata webbii]|uniref:pituitary tumor-transforming gene 1 protein-interacting protein-like isoform X1 n=1 Tax=Elgaria multicarinata webbii TaxID=159646 RepID=UPI002FCD6218